MSNTTSDTTSDITFNSTPDTTPDTTSRHIRSEIFIIYWAFIKLIEKIEKKKWIVYRIFWMSKTIFSCRTFN